MKKYLYFILLTISFCFNWNNLSAETKVSREEKASAELDYNRFRYYNPETGYYISKDPIGLLGNSLNMYAYVDDSNSEIDPFGLLNRVF